MRRVLISLMFVFLFVLVSCGGDDSSKDDGVKCTGSDKFCHSFGGMNWSDTETISMRWAVAITYCENLGGRLPTISEMRTLIQNCPVTETGGDCGVTDSCLSWDDCRNDACDGCEYDETNHGKYLVLGGYSWNFWSSSELSDDADQAWAVDFDYGDVYNGSKDNGQGVGAVCIRP